MMLLGRDGEVRSLVGGSSKAARTSCGTYEIDGGGLG